MKEAETTRGLKGFYKQIAAEGVRVFHERSEGGKRERKRDLGATIRFVDCRPRS